MSVYELRFAIIASWLLQINLHWFVIQLKYIVTVINKAMQPTELSVLLKDVERAVCIHCWQQNISAGICLLLK